MLLSPTMLRTQAAVEVGGEAATRSNAGVQVLANEDLVVAVLTLAPVWATILGAKVQLAWLARKLGEGHLGCGWRRDSGGQ